MLDKDENIPLNVYYCKTQPRVLLVYIFLGAATFNKRNKAIVVN